MSTGRMTASSSLILKFRTSLGRKGRGGTGAVADETEFEGVGAAEIESEERPNPAVTLGLKGSGGIGVVIEDEQASASREEGGPSC
jgi:hypothetical protein